MAYRSVGIRSFLRARLSLFRAYSNYPRELRSSMALYDKRKVDEMPARHALQTTDTVLMIRPHFFNYNAKTAEDNAYQIIPEHLEALGPEEIAALAVQEADEYARVLRKSGVHVIEVSPLEDQRDCPDAVFPNNWVSFHEGKIAVYPMMAESRRKERRWELVHQLAEHLGVGVVLDYTWWERTGRFLEGTGSMVLDRVNKIVYACLSERTDPMLLEQFCKDFGYEAVKFRAIQAGEEGDLVPVYHTNVMCSVGDSFALLCSSCIRDPMERYMVMESMRRCGKEVVDVEEYQVYDFVCNALQLRNDSGERVLAMSSKAYDSLRHDQLATLRRHVDRIVHSPLSTIEALGGGGARCMLAEVFYGRRGRFPHEL